MKTMLFAAALLLFAAGSAQAADCSTSESPSDKILCSDAQLQALELTLGNALKVGLDNSRVPDRDVLTANQQDFITNRSTNCDFDENGDPETPDRMRQCLLDATNSRIKYLTGLPLEGPGAPDPIVPQVFAGKDDSFVTASRFVDPKTPGEKLFNSLVYKELKDIHIAKDADDTTDAYALTLQYASPTLLSANVQLTYLGPSYAHPMPYDYAVNIDLTTGKELKMADALTKAQVKLLQKQCEGQLADYLSPHEEGAAQRKDDVDGMVADLGHWTFGAKQVVIADTDYFVEQPYTCTIGYDVLRPLIKAGFPLPD